MPQVRDVHHLCIMDQKALEGEFSLAFPRVHDLGNTNACFSSTDFLGTWKFLCLRISYYGSSLARLRPLLTEQSMLLESLQLTALFNPAKYNIVSIASPSLSHLPLADGYVGLPMFQPPTFSHVNLISHL